MAGWPDDGNDRRLVIDRAPEGGYIVSELMGAKPLLAATDIDDALGFIKNSFEPDKPQSS